MSIIQFGGWTYSAIHRGTKCIIVYFKFLKSSKNLIIYDFGTHFEIMYYSDGCGKFLNKQKFSSFNEACEFIEKTITKLEKLQVFYEKSNYSGSVA